MRPRVVIAAQGKCPSTADTAGRSHQSVSQRIWGDKTDVPLQGPPHKSFTAATGREGLHVVRRCDKFPPGAKALWPSARYKLAAVLL